MVRDRWELEEKREKEREEAWDKQYKVATTEVLQTDPKMENDRNR